MNLPKSFVLGPYTVNVLIVPDKTLQEINKANDTKESSYEVNGLWIMDESTIYVRRCSPKFSKEKQLQVFWHEFFHALFEVLGYDKLSSKEQLVDQCGMLMLQAQKTFKY